MGWSDRQAWLRLAIRDTENPGWRRVGGERGYQLMAICVPVGSPYGGSRGHLQHLIFFLHPL